MKIKIKVLSYFFRVKNKSRELLVFTHRDFPEAGTQVVGGTVEPGEDLINAIVREIYEESGLIVLPSECSKIGESIYLRKDFPEKNLRHYFEIKTNNLQNSWTHTVQSDGLDNQLVFHFFWIEETEAKKVLAGDMGEFIFN